MSVSRTQSTSRSTASTARALTTNDNQLESLLEEIAITMAMSGMTEPSVYFGEWCPKCRKDCIPMASGRCGWCDTQVLDPA